MFDTARIARVATALAGALVLSTLTVAAAVGPATADAPAPAYAQALDGVRANG